MRARYLGLESGQKSRQPSYCLVNRSGYYTILRQIWLRHSSGRGYILAINKYGLTVGSTTGLLCGAR